ncbi:MAG: SUF system Fe-S cluster assembly protein [Betaproteobacteria bacterium]|nr:SUF system Fe-S cluster assembly protein [Betaproteobacteria bacterium]
MSVLDWFNKDQTKESENSSQETTPEVANEELEDLVIAALKTVYDPEIPVNIYDLGLIYGLEIDHSTGHVDVAMTLTAPGCPVAQTFPGEVERRIMEVPGVNTAKVELVWEPPWTRERMSESAMLTLGML